MDKTTKKRDPFLSTIINMSKLETSNMIRARITLVTWFTFIVLVILIPFSSYYYFSHKRDVVEVVLQRNFGNNIPKEIPPQEIDFVYNQIRELNERSLETLLIMDVGIIILAAIIMYFLASKTLEPISKSIMREKEFVANASHELKTPISSIVLSSEIALRRTIKRNAKESEQKYINALKTINEEASYAGKMINELLNLSRMDAGSTKLNQTEIDMEKLLQDAIDQTKVLADESYVSVEFVKPKKETHIIGDYNLLKLMFSNILENAIKYNKKEGKVTVKVTNGRRTIVSIKDTGIGIRTEELPKIYDKFYRAENARDWKEGTGLGLALVKWIADNSNIIISNRSKINEGTEFEFDISKLVSKQ